MKNRNGFTLIELLATILILGIIMVIAVPTVSYLINGNNREYYNGLERMLLTSGKDYFLDNRIVLPKQVGTSTKIPLTTLVDKAYVDPIKDKNGNVCTIGNVIVTKATATEYSYQACLVCGDDYISDGCDFEGLTSSALFPVFTVIPTGWSHSKTVNIQYPTGYLNQYTLNKGVKWITYTHDLNFTSDTNIIARVKRGSNSILSSAQTVNQIDNTPPTSLDFSYTVTTKEIKIIPTATDPESGIYGYRYSVDDGATWSSVDTSSVHTENNVTSGVHKVKVTAINNTYPNEAISDKNSLTVMKEVTTSSLVAPTFTATPSTWSSSKSLTINYQAGDYFKEYSTDNVTWKTYTGPFTITANGVIYARIRDGVAANTKSSSISITTIDTTPPVLTLPALNANYGASVGITSGATITDNETGIQSIVVKYNGTDITNANQLTYPGTYTVNFMVTNGAGLTSNGTRTVNITYSFSQAFGFTGGAQTFTAPINGIYKLEVWGASGAGGGSGYGGYSTGGIRLTKGQSLYVYVGQQGLDGSSCSNRSAYNGGGAGCGYVVPGEYQVMGGGGATDIRTTANNSYANRIIVAGGGAAGWGGPQKHTRGNGGNDATARSAWTYFGISYYINANGAIGGSASITNGGCWAGSCQNSNYTTGFSGGGGGGYTGGRGVRGNTGGMSSSWPSWCDGTAEGGTSYTGGVSPLYGAGVSMSSGVRAGNGYALITLTKVE